jgi:hypothetical protein
MNDLFQILVLEIFVLVNSYFIYKISLRSNSQFFVYVIILLLLSQILLLPNFILEKDLFKLDQGALTVKSFNFSTSSFLNLYSQFFLFLYFFMFFCHYFLIFFFTKFFVKKSIIGSDSNILLINSKGGLLYTFLLLVFVSICSFLNIWMFNNSIGLTGVESSPLPYHLSGILLYFTKFIVPIIVAFLFFRSYKNIFIYLVLFLYGAILGISQISKLSAVNILGILILFSIFQKRKYLTAVLLFGTQFVILVISSIRAYIYVLDGKKITASVDEGIILKLQTLLMDNDAKFNFLDFLSNFGRIESPHNLVLAFQFDTNQIGGSFEILKRYLFLGNGYDIDAYHIALIGTTLPEGFAHGVGSFSTFFSIFIDNPFYIVFLCLIVSFYISLLDYLYHCILANFQISSVYKYVAFVFAFFFLTSLGTTYFLTIIFISLFTYILSINVSKKISKKIYHH